MALDANSLAQFTEAVARFVRERLIPAEAQVAAEDRIPDDLLRGMGELGLYGMTLPEQYGGLELNASEEMRVVFSSACDRQRSKPIFFSKGTIH